MNFGLLQNAVIMVLFSRRARTHFGLQLYGKNIQKIKCVRTLLSISHNLRIDYY